MMGILAAIKKELLEISHDRTMLLVLLVFPIFIMVFMGSSFRSMEINGLPIGVAGASNTTFTSALFSDLNTSAAFKLQYFTTENDAMEAFRNGQLRAVIVVPEDFDQALLMGQGSQLRIVVDNSDLALEQAVVSAMSAVIEASSANITGSYITGAWEQLGELNRSASDLAGDVAASRTKLQKTRAGLDGIRQSMGDIDIAGLKGSLASASVETGQLQADIESQKSAVAGAAAMNAELLNQSRIFIENASAALNDSVLTVENAYGNLSSQADELDTTIASLDNSIAGLQAIKAGTSDPATIAALDFNIAALSSLRSSTSDQLVATIEQMAELQELNETLRNTAEQLSEYAGAVDSADGAQGEEMIAALDSASDRLSSLNASFSEASDEVSDMEELMAEVDATISDADATIEAALAQTTQVDALIGTLQQTVAEQTSKDPAVIASPLSVKVENQYERTSFVDFIMPQIIALSLLLSCFLLGSISLVREKQRKTIMRALMVPGGLANLVIGKVVTLVLLSFGQMAVILAVALLFFGVSPPRDGAMLLAGAAISSLVLSSIGVLVGFYARSESAAIQSCLMLAIPMLFLGNIIFSPDLLPAYTQILQQLLPLAHVTSIFKVVLITSGDPTGDMMALLSYFILLAALMTYLIMKRNDISSYI